jgi:DNA repair protein RadC
LRRKLEDRPSLANSQETLDYLHIELAHLPTEQFRVLYLNARHRLICDQVHGEGSVTEAPVFPREVIKRAIEEGAVHLILAHNHPGGDPTPSRADIIITRAISEAGRTMGINVIDHIIISASGHVSMRSNGLI